MKNFSLEWSKIQSVASAANEVGDTAGNTDNVIGSVVKEWGIKNTASAKRFDDLFSQRNLKIEGIFDNHATRRVIERALWKEGL